MASASEVVGPSAAAWARATTRTNQKVLAGRKASAAAAARARQQPSASRSEDRRSASRPTIGPTAMRTTIAAARIQPISGGESPLLSNIFGQNGEATPKAL